MPQSHDIPTPFISSVSHVKPEWIDHNGHMNVAYYLLAFDESVGELFRYMGITHAYRREQQAGTFVGDFHIQYVRELMQGDPFRVEHQIVDCDAKRIHFCQQMFQADEGYLAARSEVISLHMDMRERRVSPMPTAMFAHIDNIRAAHAALPVPPKQGRTIAVTRKA